MIIINSYCRNYIIHWIFLYILFVIWGYRTFCKVYLLPTSWLLNTLAWGTLSSMWYVQIFIGGVFWFMVRSVTVYGFVVHSVILYIVNLFTLLGMQCVYVCWSTKYCYSQSFFTAYHHVWNNTLRILQNSAHCWNLWLQLDAVVLFIFSVLIYSIKCISFDILALFLNKN